MATDLRYVLAPRSLALIGASDRPGSLGRVLLDNLMQAGFAGEVALVNRRGGEIDGRPVAASVADLKDPVDLAVIVTPAATVPDIIDQCGVRGIRGAIVISAGFREVGEGGLALEREVVRRASRAGLRFIGPNCLGVIRTDIGLNATFGASQAKPGRIAVVSQSGALCTAILDWAQVQDVGFSSLISLGTSADVGFDDVLDYLVSDPKTDSIMLYIEGIGSARRFMSALRAAARAKPVVVMKVGRHAAGRQAARSHTGSLVGADDVFDAALRRAGVLRVLDFADFFAAAQILDTGLRTAGRRLAVVTNAGGPGVLAADHCADLALPLAELSPATKATLDAALPSAWSRGNPVDVLGDAPPERYDVAVAACLDDEAVDGVLALFTPQALASPEEVARKVAERAHAARKPLLSCWMGGAAVASARALFRARDLPTFTTPEAAVDAFAHLVAYRDSQEQLLQVPRPLGRHVAPDLDGAHALADAALAGGRQTLALAETKALLAAFGIKIASSIPAHSAADAALIAQEVGFPVAVKIDSPDITHKSDVGGVRLNVRNAREVRQAFADLVERAKLARPDAHVDGVTIEPMWRGRHARELMVGVLADPVFGPVISFGLGGTLVEVLADRAVALPPLNLLLARTMIDGTRASKWLGSFRGAPPVDRGALEDLLLRVSEMACALPWLQELDLNPVIADESGVVVVDARAIIRPYNPVAAPYAHMAIHPYPIELVQTVDLPDGTSVTVRPIRPEDAVIEQEFVNALSQRSRYLRFMYFMRELTPAMLSRFTQIDYDREMALIAVDERDGGERQVGVARYAATDGRQACEFAIVVADDWQGRGLARRLLAMLIEVARRRGFARMDGSVLLENERMLTFVQNLGFVVEPDPDDPDLLRVSLAM
ncbi:MAG: bifunctional acetate--CoA ligase family protein/GNAT family N-acetyltransferase [Planctomycetota bacterium]